MGKKSKNLRKSKFNHSIKEFTTFDVKYLMEEQEKELARSEMQVIEELGKKGYFNDDK